MEINNGRLETLTTLTQIEEEQLTHLEIEIFSQNQNIFKSFRYNPAILATATHQIMLQSANIIQKVKSTIQQAQHHKLSHELLQIKTINKIFEIVQNCASVKGMNPLIKNPSDLSHMEVSYLFNPKDKNFNILYIFGIMAEIRFDTLALGLM